MMQVLTTPSRTAATVTAAATSAVSNPINSIVKQVHNVIHHNHHHLAHSAVEKIVQLPSWPALGLAALSIFAKEWLYRLTKQVGERLNSQLLIANAWYDLTYLLSR